MFQKKTIALVSLFSFVLLFSLPAAQACGVLTHGDVCQRAAWVFADPDYPEYEEWLDAGNGALLAGAGFPDWGWLVGYTAEAEAAHSASMVEAAADYVRATYPQPWDEETRQTAVFLLGFLAHVVADTQFTTHHEQSYEEGFLGVMGELEFPDHFDLAHHYGDIGGEAFIVRANDFSYLTDWYVPTADLAQVYQNLGYDRVTPEILETAMNLMYLGSLALRALAASTADLFALLTVFEPEQYQDFFAGGLDDMGNQTAWRWIGLIDRLQNGAGDSLALPALSPAEDGRSLRRWMVIGRAMQARGEIALRAEHTARGVIFHGALNPAPQKNDAVLREVEGMDRTLTFVADTPYGYLGSSLAVGDFNQDGRDDLAMGSPGDGGPGEPQIGRVRVIYSGVSIDGHEIRDLSASPADIELTGTILAGRFGWSLAVVDLNRDGRDDLAVSAPSTGADDLSYHGAVAVYFGTGKGLAAEPDLIIESAQHRNNLGWALAGSDLDGDGYGDLLIGSPFAAVEGYQRGQVAVFLSSQNLTGGAPLSPDDAAWVQYGENDYDWFGYRLAAVDLGDAGRFLLVGAPKFNAGSALSAGRLYAYQAADFAPAFTIAGTYSLEQTGAEFAIVAPYGDDKTYLALAGSTHSAASARQGGAVWLLDPADLDGDLNLDELTPAALFRNDQTGARLGWRIGVVDYNQDGIDDLWLTEPYRQTDAGFEAGAARLYLGGESFPTGEIDGSPDSADWAIPYETAQSLFGNEIAFLDYDGDGLTDAVFGARHATDDARTNGRVVVVPPPVPAVTALDPDRATAGETLTFTLTGERLLDKGLGVRLARNDSLLTGEEIVALDAETLEFTLAVPADTEPGAYDLRLTNRFGEAALAAALTVESGTADDDDDDNDDSADDDAVDDDDNDDSADDDAVNDDDNDDISPPSGDDDDDDDDSGCGC
ncbi:MAG: hypothetical protein GX444_21110 [Myxococcales bacterium]|nr:hypothetical protein [Myxococcales bacterium]